MRQRKDGLNINFKPYTIICGHYGCGKTNLSLNIAFDLVSQGKSVTMVDLDIVNPYFRSSDYIDKLRESGIKMKAPGSSGTTLDMPALPAEIAATFDSGDYVLIDVGGDDAGATALGRFASKIKKLDYDLLYVINKYRPLTAESKAAAQLLSEIEAASRLKATGVVNNSHLMQFTDEETIVSTLPFAEETARALGLPLRFTTAPRDVAERLKLDNIYPIDIHVKTPWMN
ncbi:MAG: ParA family protein [Papillibacter sp.]|nr:ParA family protein [Papillibacter sp.]